MSLDYWRDASDKRNSYQSHEKINQIKKTEI